MDTQFIMKWMWGLFSFLRKCAIGDQKPVKKHSFGHLSAPLHTPRYLTINSFHQKHHSFYVAKVTYIGDKKKISNRNK